jgi:hypothetical protein
VTAGVAGVEADGVVDGVGATAAGGFTAGVLGGADEHPADNPDTAATTEIAKARPANLIRSFTSGTSVGREHRLEATA